MGYSPRCSYASCPAVLAPALVCLAAAVTLPQQGGRPVAVQPATDGAGSGQGRRAAVSLLSALSPVGHAVGVSHSNRTSDNRTGLAAHAGATSGADGAVRLVAPAAGAAASASAIEVNATADASDPPANPDSFPDNATPSPVSEATGATPSNVHGGNITVDVSDLSMDRSSLPYNATHYPVSEAWPATDYNAAAVWPCEYPLMDCNGHHMARSGAAAPESHAGPAGAAVLALLAILGL